MVQVAELLDPSDPGPLWPLLRQVGVDQAVSLLEEGEQKLRWLRRETQKRVPESPTSTSSPEASCWSAPALERLVNIYAAAGFSLAALEDTPPMDKVRLGLPGREEEIGLFCEQLRAMGEVGIPLLCYNWNAVDSWARTTVDLPTRGGALTTGYDDSVMSTAPPAPGAELTSEESLWENLEFFLRQVVPVAEEAGVRLALHPDDPPIPSVRGVARIMHNLDAFQRAVDLVPSESNGITFCQGNFTLMTDDLPAAIRHFGHQGKIFFVHFRDVQGTPEHFVETFHDIGPTDMLACMHAYREIGFDGPLRPDHVQTLYGETNRKPGYETLGRLFAVGYIAGLREAVYGKQPGISNPPDQSAPSTRTS